MRERKRGRKRGKGRERGRIHCKDNPLSIIAISQHSSFYNVCKRFYRNLTKASILEFLAIYFMTRLCTDIRIQTTLR